MEVAAGVVEVDCVARVIPDGRPGTPVEVAVGAGVGAAPGVESHRATRGEGVVIREVVVVARAVLDRPVGHILI